MTATIQQPLPARSSPPEFVADTNDPTAGAVALSRELASEQVRMIADPAPLGLGAFALTTFLLSLVNAGIMALLRSPQCTHRVGGTSSR